MAHPWYAWPTEGGDGRDPEEAAIFEPPQKVRNRRKRFIASTHRKTLSATLADFIKRKGVRFYSL